MNKITAFFSCSLILSAMTGTAAAQYADDWAARSFYENARRNNQGAIARMKRNGWPIDATDSNGDTALCLAMKNGDERAYNILKANGANVNHSCTAEPEKKKELTYRGGVVWKPMYTVGTIAVAGGIAALAAGGGGGGGSGSSSGNNNSGDNGGNNGDSTGDVNGGVSTDDIVTPLASTYFETDEYQKGNFLSDIKASTAYSRLYGLDANGKLASKIESVTVGVLDSGVDSRNNDFQKTSVTGFNMDYGPCRNGDNTHCWAYGNGIMQLTIDNPDGGEVTYYIHNVDESDYQEWAAGYSDDYDWDENSDSWLPEELVCVGGNCVNSDVAHGTHVAGIIAADKNDSQMHGVAFSNAQIIAGRWDFRFPMSIPLSKMVDMGAQVVNMSLGVDSTDLINAKTLQGLSTENAAEIVGDGLGDMILDGIDKAIEKNTVLVMAAGNNGKAQPGILNGVPLMTDYAERLKNLFITVVATGHDGKIAGYSNRCGATAAYCIAAPGGDSTGFIWSTVSKGDMVAGMAGTSMATPVVTGSVALLMGAYPYLTPQQVVELIFETANNDGVYADSATYGHGMLDLAEATNPQGYLGTIGGDTTDGERTNVAATSIRVPAAFKEALVKNMPKTMTVFDKYNRPFQMKLSALVSTTHSGEKKFKNDLYNFSRHQPKTTVATEGFTFGFAPSAYNNTDSGMGIIDMSYQGDNYKTSFFFAENSEYSSGVYQNKTLFNPYLAMNNVYGLSNSLQFDKLGFKFDFMTGENGLYDGDKSYNDYNFDKKAYAFNSEVSYKVTPEFDVSAMSGVLSEDDALLGMNGHGALNIENSNTFYTGLMLNWKPSEKWSFSGAYYHGLTDGTNAAGSMMSTSRLMSNSFALDGHYNMNKTDVVGLQLSSPLRIYNGHADFDIATGRDNFSSTVYREKVRASLKPSAREYKFALYHNRELKEDVLLKSEFALRLNPEHQSDAETDYRAMIGLSWAF